MKKKVAIVIPNWNGADMIAACLTALGKQTHPADVIVVDNGSVDNSVALIEKQFPETILIQKDKNYGFAGGVNIGIRYALKHGYDAVALINNDAKAEKNWLEKLVRVLDANPHVGIASSKQLRTDKKHLDSTGDQYSIWGIPFPRGRNIVDKGQYDRQEEIFSAPGGATLYRSSLFKAIGLFDEAFFAYYEDVDISFRARLAGWKIVYEPSARVYHHVSATSSKLGTFTRYHTTKNLLMLYGKNMPGWLFWKYLPRLMVQMARLLLGSVIHGGFGAYLKGLAVFVLRLPYVVNARRQIQKHRTVKTDVIDGWLYHDRPPKIPSLSPPRP